MTKTVKYTGTQERWPELAATGKQSVWMPGQAEERSDVEAAQLLATGQFNNAPAVVQSAGGNIAGLNLRSSLLAALVAAIWQDINVPLQSGCTSRPIYRTFIDAINGNDAWDGSSKVFVSGAIGPKRTGNIASWTGTKTTWFTGEALLFCAGQTHTITSTSTTLALASNRHLGAWWPDDNPSAARPVIRSLLNTGAAGAATRAMMYASGTLADISISDLVLDTSDVPNRDGIAFFATAAGQSIRNVTISNVDVVGGTITDAVAYTGFSFEYYLGYATLSAYTRSYNIRIEHCNALAYPGHGFGIFGAFGTQLANGRWHGVDLINCAAIGCGAGYDTHGFTSYSGNVLLDQTSGGWVNVAAGPDVATNTNSRIFYVSLNSRYGRDVPDMDIVHMDTGTGTELFKLIKNTAAPTLPNQGEFGYDPTPGTGAVRLYANFGATISASNRFSMAACAVRGVRYIRCLAHGQKWAARTSGREGHGFAFDDFSSNCSIIECASTDNEGHGITINRGDGNQIVATTIAGNALACIKGNFGWDHYVGKCLLSGSGYSDTAPGYKGLIHIAHASHKAYGPNGTWAGATAAPSSYGSVVASSIVTYTGQDTAVAVLLGPTSNNAPPLLSEDTQINAGVGKVQDGGRAWCVGRPTSAVDIPAHMRGTGVQV